MPTERATLLGHGTGYVDFDTAREMEGGMKRVYFSLDKSKVVAFFKDPKWAQANRIRLEKVVDQYNPTKLGQTHASFYRELYCWPTDIVTHPQFGLGLLLPAYPQEFFFKEGGLAGKEKDGAWFNGIDPTTRRSLRYSFVHSSERGNLATYLAALSRVARAVHRLHAAGLAHSDLSERNVLIDPCTGKAIIIDVDALVVEGVHPPDVLGTPGFIAPEVLASRNLPFSDPGRKHASAETDRYALAVLIYRFLLERHPLVGPRRLPGLSAEHEEEALMGAKALYSEHPSDLRNRPKSLSLSSKILGPTIENLFRRAFVDGLRVAGERPTADSWVNALTEAFDRLLACSNLHCSHRWFVLLDPTRPVCPYCATHYRGTFSRMSLKHVAPKDGYVTPQGEVVLNGFRDGDGTLLFRHHTYRYAPRGPGQDSNILAKVVFLREPTPAYYLQNVGLETMQVRKISPLNTEFQPFPRGHKLMLSNGLELRFGDEPEALTATIETFCH